MDDLLLPLLSARDEQERQQRLDDLLTMNVAPIVRQVLRQRLGFYVSARGANKHDYDAEDVYQDAMTRMVELLHKDELTRVDSFEHYVGRVASNICVDFLRSKYPARTRLKDALRGVFRRDANLVSWQHDGEIMCGFAAWRNTGPRGPIDVDTRLNAFVAARFADEDVRVVPLSRVVVELLEWTGGPVQIDVLVGMLACVRDTRERQTESLDVDVEENFRGSIRSIESDVETHELLRRLWHIVKRLTPKQRDAFVLRFHDPAGRNLFTVLLAAGIVDWDELATGMGRPVADVLRVWTQMPMDSATAASELHTTCDNVYKWRYRAMQKLKGELH